MAARLERTAGSPVHDHMPVNAFDHCCRCLGEKRRRERMRTMVKFTIPTTEETNARIKDGSIEQTLDTLCGNLQPEAAYF